jgi:hypothetical protein
MDAMKKRLVVVVEDGAISAIVSDNPEDFQDIDIIAVNYDCDEREGGFQGEAQRCQANRIWTSFPRSASMAWNGVL